MWIARSKLLDCFLYGKGVVAWMHGNLAERLNFGFAVVGHGQMVKSLEKVKVQLGSSLLCEQNVLSNNRLVPWTYSESILIIVFIPYIYCVIANKRDTYPWLVSVLMWPSRVSKDKIAEFLTKAELTKYKKTQRILLAWSIVIYLVLNSTYICEYISWNRAKKEAKVLYKVYEEISLF